MLSVHLNSTYRKERCAHNDKEEPAPYSPGPFVAHECGAGVTGHDRAAAPEMMGSQGRVHLWAQGGEALSQCGPSAQCIIALNAHRMLSCRLLLATAVRMVLLHRRTASGAFPACSRFSSVPQQERKRASVGSVPMHEVASPLSPASHCCGPWRGPAAHASVGDPAALQCLRRRTSTK